jgi:predicted transcriptional regulator
VAHFPVRPGERRLTFACRASTLKPVKVHLPQNQEAQLNELAVKTGRGTDELVQEAVAKLLSHSQWFKQQVQIGVEQIARGEFIEDEAMDARVDRMLQT